MAILVISTALKAEIKLRQWTLARRQLLIEYHC